MEHTSAQTQEMTKPASLLITELKNNITTCINDSNLHPLILAMLLKEIYISVQENANVFAQNEIAAYETQTKQQSKETNHSKTEK